MDKEIGVYEAKTRFSELADRVARGESFTITRRGRPIGTLRPIQSGFHQNDIERALDAVRKIREDSEEVTQEDIRQWRDEGRS